MVDATDLLVCGSSDAGIALLLLSVRPAEDRLLHVQGQDPVRRLHADDPK